jgi:hypothetical protein
MILNGAQWESFVVTTLRRWDQTMHLNFVLTVPKEPQWNLGSVTTNILLYSSVTTNFTRNILYCLSDEPGELSRYSDWLRAGWSEFDSRRGLEIFLFDTMTRPALRPTQLPIQWVPGALFLGVKRPGREAGHSLPSSAEVKECVEIYLHSPNVFMAWCVVKQRDAFTFIPFTVWMSEWVTQSVTRTTNWNQFRTEQHTQDRVVFRGSVTPPVSGTR